MRTWLRTYLGITHLEEHMATILEALKSIGEQQQALSAAQLASFTNLQTAIQRLEAAVREGQVSPEVQAAVDQINESFRTMQAAASSADDGYELDNDPGDDEQPGDTDPDTPAEDTAGR